MLFIFSTPELIRNMWQLKTAVFLHWCLIRGVPLDPLECGIEKVNKIRCKRKRLAGNSNGVKLDSFINSKTMFLGLNQVYY